MKIEMPNPFLSIHFISQSIIKTHAVSKEGQLGAKRGAMLEVVLLTRSLR